MKKRVFIYATAALLMASCANDDFIGDTTKTQNGEQPILFNMQGVASSRTQTTGYNAATALGNEFIVWGEKTNNSTITTVFQNYRVQYVGTNANSTSGNSTVTNTNGWEYVGIAPYAKVSNDDVVSPNILSTTDDNIKQTIKYWDTTQGTTYNFTAVSALQTDIKDGKVKITRNPTSTEPSSQEGYTIVLTNGADATKIYVADKQPNVSPLNQKDNITQPVTMAFRNFQSKIRFGFYETVQGYKVQITGVKYNKASENVTDKFGVDGKFIKSPSETNASLTYNVTYDSSNKPVLSTTTSGSVTDDYKEIAVETQGTTMYNSDLGTASTNPTYNLQNNAYTAILPNTGNQQDMSFTISYKLISEDTQEVIAVTDKKVTVPAVYCQWKPNFAYTYLFKISDSSTGLTPITFDAVVEADETGDQETITEFGDDAVSLTTFATSSDGKSVITGQNEYASGNVIYATTNVSGGLTNENTHLYTVTLTKGKEEGTLDHAAQSITEAAVANCIAHGTNDTSAKTYTVKDANGWTMTAIEVTLTTSGEGSNFVTSVPNENGVGDRTINALKWTASNSNNDPVYYAVEFSNTVNSSTTKYYKIVKVVKQ